ncbi:hypothetical protein OROMI_013393 [Orobanche minor]
MLFLVSLPFIFFHRALCSSHSVLTDGSRLFYSRHRCRNWCTIARMENSHGAAVNRIVNLTESTIASGDGEGCIKVWDTRQRSCCNSFSVHEEYISDMTFASDSMKLIGTRRFNLDQSSLRMNCYLLSKLENEKSRVVNENDLRHLHTLGEEKDDGPSWIQMMDRSTSGTNYQAWRRDPERFRRSSPESPACSLCVGESVPECSSPFTKGVVERWRFLKRLNDFRRILHEV